MSRIKAFGARKRLTKAQKEKLAATLSQTRERRRLQKYGQVNTSNELEHEADKDGEEDTVGTFRFIGGKGDKEEFERKVLSATTAQNRATDMRLAELEDIIRNLQSASDKKDRTILTLEARIRHLEGGGHSKNRRQDLEVPLVAAGDSSLL